MKFNKWGNAIENDVSNAVFGTLMYSLVWCGLDLMLRWLGSNPFSFIESTVGVLVLGAFSAWAMGFCSFRSCGIQLRRMLASHR